MVGHDPRKDLELSYHDSNCQMIESFQKMKACYIHGPYTDHDLVKLNAVWPKLKDLSDQLAIRTPSVYECLIDGHENLYLAAIVH